jgi:peptide/nickel transport system substrate-binding protein
MTLRNRTPYLVISLLVLLSFIFTACAPAPTPAAPPPGQAAPTAPPQQAQPTDPPTPLPTTPTAAPSTDAPPLSEDRLIPELTFLLPASSYDPIRYESGLLIVREWERLGLRVNIVAMDFTALANRLQNELESYHAFISGYVSRPERLDPDVLLYRPFSCTGVDTGTNYQGYCNEEYEALVNAQRQEMDPNVRLDLVHQVQEILHRDVPAIALYHVKEIHTYNSRLFTDVTPMMGQGLWNFWSLLSTRPITDARTLAIGQAWDLDSPNPFVATGGGNIETLRLVYDLLARVAPDGSVTPWAAESWELIDPTAVRVKVREGMQFHDGQPVTAEDVKFSYDIQKELGAPIYKPFLDPISEIELVDEYTLIFHLANPYPPLYQATFAQIYILPKHIWEDVEGVLEEVQVTEPIGSGPFRWGEWRVGESIHLLANQNHFNAPQVDGIIQVVYSNPDAIFLGLVNENVHMHDRRLLPSQIPEIGRYEHLTEVETEDFGVYYMGFNLRMPPFDDLAFRQALSHTVNFNTIVNTLLDGYAVPGVGFIAPANQVWYNPAIQPYEFNLDLARQILTEAGYQWDNQGRLYMPAR